MRRRALESLVLLALGIGLAACTGGEFPATSACPEEPRAAGRLPDLEVLLPSQLGGRPPDTLDSGWNCLSSTLQTYAAHGVTRLQFAGATWDEGNGDGAVAAVFETAAGDPPLQPRWVEEFYETGARASRSVENVQTRRVQIAGPGDGWRLDALNNLSLQTIVVWPHGAHVHVVLAASTVEPEASRDEHEERVDAALVAAASAPGDDPELPTGSSGSPASTPDASVMPSLGP